MFRVADALSSVIYPSSSAVDSVRALMSNEPWGLGSVPHRKSTRFFHIQVVTLADMKAQEEVTLGEVRSTCEVFQLMVKHCWSSVTCSSECGIFVNGQEPYVHVMNAEEHLSSTMCTLPVVTADHR